MKQKQTKQNMTKQTGKKSIQKLKKHTLIHTEINPIKDNRKP